MDEESNMLVENNDGTFSIKYAMRNPFAKHLDFTDLQGVIEKNPKWLPSNIDMMAERNGKFLICEWKRPNEEFGGGQKILLQALANAQNFTVLIVQGNTDNGMIVENFWQLMPWKKLYLRGSGLFSFKSFIQDWYEGA